MTSGLGRLAVNISASNSLVAGAAKGPLGEFTIAGLVNRVGRLDLQTQTGEISMRVEASGKAEDFSSLLYAVEDLPDVQLNSRLSKSTRDVRRRPADAQAARRPGVDISSAVSNAIGGVLLNVFPPTMVASMLEGASKGGGPSFEPIGFAPGSKELDAAGISNADGVAQLLAEHPGLSLKVCGRSTAQDMEHFMSDAAPVRPPVSGVMTRSGQSEARPAKPCRNWR